MLRRGILITVLVCAALGAAALVTRNVWPNYPSSKLVIERLHSPALNTAHRNVVNDPSVGLIAIVPLPREISRFKGAIQLGEIVAIQANSDDARAAAVQLEAELERLGARATIEDSEAAAPDIRLVEEQVPEVGDEGYRLDVSGFGVTIAARTGAGLFYGTQTLEQLISNDGKKLNALPFVHIVDWPEYRWRGLHLDVSRHFFPVDVVEQYIDVAARFKLNVFHWHLTDDQGWRIDLPQYPRLAAIGGCRDGTEVGELGSADNDGIQYCGSYSETEIREVVKYAAARHVTIVPEIEGPGHSVELLAAYPELACEPGPYATMTQWGSTKYSVCPTEKTFQFFGSVFKELAKLFPGPQIHIGGDEVPTFSWRDDPQVAALMRRYGIETYSGVQGYFTRRLEQIAKTCGKQIVGWDEIAKAPISDDAIVMAWTGSEAGGAAARRGNDVVMSPDPPLYFDAYQGPASGEPPALGGVTTLRRVYDYDPIDSVLVTPTLRRHVLGVQGNVWTEYISTPRHLWYMVYPRALALAELDWTPRTQMRWSDFEQRAGIALQRLESLYISFRIPEVSYRLGPAEAREVATDLNAYRAELSDNPTERVELVSVVPNAVVHFTTDGTAPTVASPTYARPLQVRPGTTVKAIASLDPTCVGEDQDDACYLPSAVSSLVVTR